MNEKILSRHIQSAYEIELKYLCAQKKHDRIRSIISNDKVSLRYITNLFHLHSNARICFICIDIYMPFITTENREKIIKDRYNNYMSAYLQWPSDTIKKYLEVSQYLILHRYDPVYVAIYLITDLAGDINKIAITEWC